MDTPSYAFVVWALLAASFTPFIVGWFRQVWACLQPRYATVLGTPGRWFADYGRAGLVLLTAPAGLSVAALGLWNRWPVLFVDPVSALAPQMRVWWPLVLLGLALYVAGYVALATGPLIAKKVVGTNHPSKRAQAWSLGLASLACCLGSAALATVTLSS